MKKDTIYIDVEDDITAIIDKVAASKSSLVAVVPPKRSTVLLSVVNMKLLKRSIADAKKTIVLVSNERAIESLAGGVGLHVAKDLKSKPFIPKAPEFDASDSSVIQGSAPEGAINTPIGKLDDEHKGVAASAPVKNVDAKKDTVKESAAIVAATNQADESKAAAKKGLKIPNFERFRLRIILGVVAVLVLAVGWWFAFVQLPSATVLVKAQTSRVTTSVTLTADPAISESNIDESQLVATTKEIKKTVSEKFTATGEKDIGQKASGVVSVQNCDSSDSITIASGTGFSSGGLTFISSESVEVPGGSFSGGGCDAPGVESVSVVAQKAGDDYNLASGASYTIAGQGGLVSGVGEQISGGTSEVATVVSQADVDGAKAKVLDVDSNAAKSELLEQFAESDIVIDASFVATTGDVVSEPAVGTEAAQGQVTVQYTYTMQSIKKSDVAQLLAKEQEKELKEAQSVYENGVDDATYKLTSSTDAGVLSITASTIGFIGPDIDTQKLAESIKGKRFSEAVDIVNALPGVNEVDIDFAPFWVFSAPNNAEKITITLEVADATSPATDE